MPDAAMEFKGPSIGTLVRALKDFYDPRVRGLHSKKGRQRKKSFAKYRQTLRYQIQHPAPNLLLDLVPKGGEWGGGYVSLPWGS